MFDRIDSTLLPFIDSEARRLLQDGVLPVDDHQALLDEAKKKRKAWESTLEPTEEQLLAFMHEDERAHVRSGRADKQFWDGIKAQWRAKQMPSDHPDHPINPPSPPEPEPPPEPPSDPVPEFDGEVSARADEIRKATEGAPPVRITTPYEIAREQIEKERAGESESKVIQLGPASSEIREDGYSDADVRGYLERRYAPRDSPREATTGWRIRLESTKSFFKHLNGIVRIAALALAGGALNWSWQVLGADEYLVAFLLLGAFVLFVLVSLYGWKGVPEYPNATKAVKILLLVMVVGIAAYSAAVFWRKKGDKPWTNLWANRAQSKPSDATDGGFIQVFERELISPGTFGPSAYLNLKYQAKGDKTVIGVVHRQVVFDAQRQLSREEIERLLGVARGVAYQRENEIYELQPDSPIQLNTTPNKDDDSSKNLTEIFPAIESGKTTLYSIVVFKYRYKGMPDGIVRLTENCAWISGRTEVNAWHNCWNRVYDAPEH